MANHVLNEVEFRGPASQLTLAAELFRQMENCQPKTEDAQWPDFFIEMPKRYFAYIDIAHLPGSLKIDYQTDWYPNPEDLVTIATHYGLDFQSSYVEHGNGYYGACKFNEGKFLHTWIEEADLMKIEYNPDTDQYVVDDITFRYQGNCFGHILKEKLDLLEQTISQSRGR